MSIGEQKSLFDENKSEFNLSNLELQRPLVFFDLETTGLDISNFKS